MGRKICEVTYFK